MGNIINKVVRVGNSMMILIPSNICKIYDVRVGDIIEVDFEKNHRDSVKNG